LLAFATQVSTFIEALGGSSLGDSGFWMIGRRVGVTSFFGFVILDTVRSRNPRTLGGLKTLGFPSFIAILHLGQFFGDQRPCKQEVASPKWL